MTFELHKNLREKIFIADFPLCSILLEDDKYYPWLILVPRRPHVSRMMDLSHIDQFQLMKELDVVQRVVWEEFKPDQLNVAAIGNKTPQLHIHIIARYVKDPAWPQTVWDHPLREPYEKGQKNLIIEHYKSLMTPFIQGLV